MAYTSVTGGADAIAAAERLIQQIRLDSDEQRLEIRQVRNQMRAAVDQVMGEGGLYAPDLAALALRQAEGDMAESSFMIRAYRSTLPRFGYSLPVRGDEMRVVRRISSTFRDVPGGQLLGRTRDYTQRLLDLESGSSDRDATAAEHEAEAESSGQSTMPEWDDHPMKVSDAMRAMGLIGQIPDRDESVEPADITRHSMRFPVTRSAWLQGLARAETGALVCLAYSAMRGYGGGSHGTIAELRVGDLPIRIVHPLTGKPVTIGHVRATECEMTGGTKTKGAPRNAPGYGLSYGLVFGQNERKAISMSLLDSSLMAGVAEGANPAPANDQEMVLYNTDGIESFGFVEHLKLPHFVTFGSGLEVSSKPALAAADVAPAATEAEASGLEAVETRELVGAITSGGSS